MAGPPSLDSLHISSSPSKSFLHKNAPPLSPSPSPPPDGDNDPDGNGPSKPSVNGTSPHPSKPSVEDTPPQTPGPEAAPSTDAFASHASPPPSTPAQAPPLPSARPNPVPAASAPAIGRTTLGRPPAGVPARGNIPMGMGMRGPAMGLNQMQSRLPPSLQAKMDKVAARGAQAPSPHGGPAGPSPNATSMGALLRSQALGGTGGAGGSGPSLPGPASGPLSLAARRAGGAPRPNLAQMGAPPSAPAGLGARGALGGRRVGPPGGMTLSSMAGAVKEESSKFSDFGQIMDPSGSLRFSSKAVLHAKGVDFEDGQSFKINMDEIEIIGELGKGNYGAVQQVLHRPSQIVMAMKEIRLELDESKLNGIIMELDILHRAVAPEIVEFYGAFTIESCVYYCMEYMDAGSLDTLTGGGVPAKNVQEETEEAAIRVPEPVLRRITAAIVRGLGFLKDELQIMHRDVKPTNVLINKKGEIKLCDFGVSGQLEKSLAKTNIGCQSYMAPERIKGESQNQISTYTVSSDVWSLGLSIIELAKGCYPYPPETFANVFAQLQAIVYGPAPTLPKGYSADAHDFVAKCLLKDPNARPTYAELLEHPFLLADKDAEVDMVEWVAHSLERRAALGVKPLQPIEA